MAQKVLNARNLYWQLPAQHSYAIAVRLQRPMRNWLIELAGLVCDRPSRNALNTGTQAIPICYGTTSRAIPGPLVEALIEEYTPHKARGMHLAGFSPGRGGVYAAFTASDPLRRMQDMLADLLRPYIREPRILEPLFVLLGTGVREVNVSISAYEFAWSAPSGLVVGDVNGSAMTTPYIWRGRDGVEIDARYFHETQ